MWRMPRWLLQEEGKRREQVQAQVWTPGGKMSTLLTDGSIFPVKCERTGKPGQGQFRGGRRQGEELFRRASLLRNRQVSWVVLRPFGAGGHELSVVPFCLSVGWASVAPNCERTGSSSADGYVRPGAQS